MNDSLSWVKGKHMFKFGGEYRHMDNRGWTTQGTLGFDLQPRGDGVTGKPWSNQVGFGFASFLLGNVQRGQRGDVGRADRPPELRGALRPG